MSIITTNEQLESLEDQVKARGCRLGKAFKRHAAIRRHLALCQDAERIHNEAISTKVPTWGDMDW